MTILLVLVLLNIGLFAAKKATAARYDVSRIPRVGAAQPQPGWWSPQAIQRGFAPAKAALKPSIGPSARVDVARQLNHKLAHTPLRHQGFELEAAGWRAHLHPAFIAAASAVESSFGAAPCRSNPRNIWGLASCGSGIPYLSSWREAFDYFTAFVHHYWGSPASPWDLHGYCPPCGSRWGDKVAWYMRWLGFAPSLRYGS